MSVDTTITRAAATADRTLCSQPFPKWTRATFPKSGALADSLRIPASAHKWACVCVSLDGASHALRATRRRPYPTALGTTPSHPTLKRTDISLTPSRVTVNRARSAASCALPQLHAGKEEVVRRSVLAS